MQIKRLRPENGAAKAIIDATSRIKHLETRPSGTIVITDKLIARDPETGVETILGQLPDGSFGIQPNINDTVPPNKPSTPKTEPALGAVSLTWDGMDAAGAAQPRDYARTEVMYREVSATSATYTLGAIFYDANTVLVTGLTSDVPYEFRLVSYDTNGNASEFSGRALGTPANFVDNTDVAEAIAGVRKEAQDATSASASAQGAAAKAQETATAAAEEAARAAGLAGSGSGVIFSETAPTDPKDRTDSKLWIDTSGTPAKNTPNRWDGVKWVAVTDKAALDAAAKATAAETAADLAAASAASAAGLAGEAQRAANGKNRVWYRDSAPAGNAHTVGDTWFDSANGNVPKVWNGSAWVSAQDASIATAKSVADSALTTANGKNSVFYQTDQPTSTTVKPLKQGDLWFDTDGGYAQYTYSGSAWVKTQDSAAASKKADDANSLAVTAKNTAETAVSDAAAAASAALAASNLAGTKGKLLVQSTAPTGADANAQTLWIDTTGGLNAPKRWTAAKGWETVTDKTATDAASAAAKAQADATKAIDDASAAAVRAGDAITSASGKATVRYADTAPTGSAYKVNDLWFDSSNGNKPMRWDGAKWASIADAAIADAQKTADRAVTSADGKTTTYYQTSQPTGGTYAKGDMWFDTDDNYALYVHSGSAWLKAQDAAKVKADALADATSKADNALAYALGSAPRGANVVLNGSFDQDFTGWTKEVTQTTSNYGIDTTVSRTGGRSLWTTGKGGFQQQGVPVVAGQTWEMALWYKTESTFPNNAAGGIRLQAIVNGAWIDAASGGLTMKEDWFRSSLRYVIPEGVTQIRPRFAFNYSGGAKVWIDDVELVNITAELAASADATTKANAAQTAAVLAAQADAKAQTEAAEARVALVAAEDAKRKADDAQSAALAAAKTYADTQASGAQGAALEAAKADATEKANAAKAAAIEAASLDATAKAEEAERVAAIEAQRLANVALEAAKTDAATKVATKNKTWIQTSRPALTGNITGDTWIDTSTAGGNKLNVWNGSAWVAAQDAAIATAQGAAGAALTAANGKNKIIFNTSDATGTTGYTAGDLWMKRDANGVIIAQWEFTTSWQKRTIGETVIGNLSAGKITSGTIAADRIGANTIGVTKLSVADLTNLLEDPLFTQALPSPYWTGNITDITTATDHPTVGTGNVLKITGTASIRDVTSTRIAASPGDEFYAEVWVKPLATGMKGSVQIASTVNLVPSGSTWPSFAQLDLSTLTPNVWTKISGSIKTPSNAKGLFIRLSLRENVASGDVLFAAPALRRKNGGELLVDGSIKAGSAIIAEGAIGTAQIGDAQITNAKIKDLNATKINAGTIGADRIGANSINATKLVLTDNSNLWPNQYFADDLTTTYHVGAAYTGTEVPPLGKCRLLSGRDHIASTASHINARYGDSFVIEAVVKRTLGDVRLAAGLWMYKSAGVITPSPYRYAADSVVVATLANGWERRRWIITFGNASDVDATLGLLYFQIEQTTANPTTNWLLSDVTVRRRNGGELLVDGSIRAGSAIIATGAIGTAQIGDAQITNAKINDLNASKITAGVIAADRLDANTIRAKIIAAEDINAADILVSGSITSASGVIGELDAGVITSGYISADRIQAGSLTIGAVQGLQSTVDAATAANSTVTAWQGSDGKVDASNVTGTLAATVPGAKVTGTVPVAAVPALPTSKVTNLDSALTNASNTTTKVNGWTFAGTTEINGGSIRTDTITATQIKAASLTSASGVFGDLSAASLTSGTIAADRLVANDIRAKIIAADDINAVDIIASNSITATNGIIGSIDAAKISVGTLDAARIAAQSITADKVIIGQGTNLITDPAFMNNESNTARAARSTGTWTFQTDTTTGVKSAKTTTTTTYNSFMFGIVTRSASNAANMIPVTPGERYLMTASVYTNTSAAIQWGVEFVRADGTVGFVQVSSTHTSSGRRAMPAFEYVVPAGVVAFNPALTCLTTGVTWAIDAGASVARKVEGNLIVDGAIDGQTITGALIQSVSANNRGIKLSASQFVAYDNSGTETLRLDGSNAVITGATVQTAVTGARVIMDKTGLRAFPATGTTPYLTASAAGLELTGTMKTTGTSTEAPGSVITTIVGPTPINGGIERMQTVPGVGFYSSSVASTTDSPPSVVSTDGIGLEIRGSQQKLSQNMAAYMYLGDKANILMTGNVDVYGRIRQVVPVGRHMEWSGSLSIPARGSESIQNLTLDVPKSPGTNDADHKALYTFATFSSGRLTFKETGLYYVGLKGALYTGPATDTASIHIYEDGWAAQAGYILPGHGDYATAGGPFYMQRNSYLTFSFKHGTPSAVGVNLRLKVTVLA